jgi:hypothetical protein
LGCRNKSTSPSGREFSRPGESPMMRC